MTIAVVTGLFYMNKDKIILKLINATNKASRIDLALFLAIVSLKYDEDNEFGDMCFEFREELKKNPHIIALLCKTIK